MPSKPFVFASGNKAPITVAKLMGAPALSIETSVRVPLADFVFAASAASAAVMEVAVPSVSIFVKLVCAPPSGVIAGAAGAGGTTGAVGARPAELGSVAVGCTSAAGADSLGIMARYAGRPYLYVTQPMPTTRMSIKSHKRSLPDFISRTSGIGAGAGAVCTGNCTGAAMGADCIGCGGVAIGGGGVTGCATASPVACTERMSLSIVRTITSGVVGGGGTIFDWGVGCGIGTLGGTLLFCGNVAGFNSSIVFKSIALCMAVDN